MNTKICKKCGIEKNIDEFYKNKRYKENYENVCKLCKNQYYLKNKEKILNRIHNYYNNNCETIKEYKKQYRKDNKQKFKNKDKKYYEANKDIILKKSKIYYFKNKDKISETKKIYRENHKEEIKIKRKIYAMNNKEKRNIYNKNKYKNDYVHRFKILLRSSINRYIKKKGKTKNKHTEEIIGCNYEYLTQHLLKTYKDNYGIEWDGIEKINIDHIIPLATAKNENDIIKLNHYTNLQLLKEKDNFEKSDKLDWKL